MVKLGSLCSGYGGLDLAAEAFFDAETVWHSETDPDCSRVLAAQLPGIENVGDLTTVDWTQVEPVDILCAGFPCQPVSAAGNRKGISDERWLWDDIRDSIGVLRPRYIVLENVAGLLSMGRRTGGGCDVVAALTSMGYDSRWGVVRASDAGAPHRRARWFCIASDTDGVAGPTTVAGGRRRGEVVRPGTVERTLRSDGGAAADAGSERYGQREDSRRLGLLDRRDERTPRQRQRPRGELSDRSIAPAANANGRRFQDLGSGDQLEGASQAQPLAAAFGPYEPAIRRWERIIGRPFPAPTDDRGLRPQFVEWMMGLPDGWVTSLDMTRSAALQMLGNGVCPQQATLALTILDQQVPGE